jgi:hypothetical protein
MSHKFQREANYAPRVSGLHAPGKGRGVATALKINPRNKQVEQPTDLEVRSMRSTNSRS